MGNKYYVKCAVCPRHMSLSQSEFIRRRTCSNKCKAIYLSKKPVIIRKAKEAHQVIMMFNPLVGWFLYALFLVLIFAFGMQYVPQSGIEFEVENAKAQDVEVPDFTGYTIKEQVEYYAKKYGKEYGVSSYQMIRTVECESKFRNIQSQVRKNGKQENSWGVAQIHIDSHKDVSKKQALNVEFSMKWMASHWNSAVWYAYSRKYDRCN